MNPTSLTPPTCLHCGSALPVDSTGSCPRCLMLAAIHPTEPQNEEATVPTLSLVSAAFPLLEIMELIGQGGMGWVFKARQPKLDRLVALKLLPASLAKKDAAFADRFLREGKLLAKLHHPNIVAVHDSGTAGEFFYLLMEYVEGVNLRQAMRSAKFTPAQALAIVPMICDALQFAHDEGVLHRDIKPENILLDGKGRVKLADFGIAKLMGSTEAALGWSGLSEASENLTQNGAVLGTPNYMAPEQRQTPAEVDHRADIYSLGVVFYELLTGELPTGSFPAPSQVSTADPRVDAIVQQALQQERTRRQHSAEEMKTQVTGLNADYSPAEISAALNQVRFIRGFDYKSKKTLFGLPLLNVSSGMDPATGKPRVARGIVAIGNRAYGWFAFGGVASGGFAVGGVAAGVVAIGGCAAGLVAIGGCALALLVAIGGWAVGYFGLGGTGFGMHVADGTHTTSWLSVWVKDNFSQFLPPYGVSFIIWFNLILCALIVFPILMTQWARRKVDQLSSQSDPNFNQAAQEKRRKLVRKLRNSVLIAVPLALFLRTFVIQMFVIKGDSAAPEIPRGSWVLAWKLTKNYAVGDFIVYLEGDTVFLGKVTVVGEAQLHVIRFGQDNYVIPREKVLGRVMFNTRPSTKETAPDSGPQPSVRVEPKVVIPVTTMKDLDKGKTKTSPVPLPKPVAPEPIANGKIRIGVRPAIMKFDIEEFTVASGTEVTILFSNEKCPLQHNLSILRPGTLEVVTAAADRMLSDPDGMKKNYFPDVPEILVKGNKLIGTGQSDLITFTAPEPGDYPYVCTFPGHVRLMRGVMHVVSPTNSSPNGSPK